MPYSIQCTTNSHCVCIRYCAVWLMLKLVVCCSPNFASSWTWSAGPCCSPGWTVRFWQDTTVQQGECSQHLNPQANQANQPKQSPMRPKWFNWRPEVFKQSPNSRLLCMRSYLEDSVIFPKKSSCPETFSSSLQGNFLSYSSPPELSENIYFHGGFH